MAPSVRAAVVVLAALSANAVAGPLFSEENCKGMFDRKLSLGSAVPPEEFVTGCMEVCAKVKEMKDYWKTGEFATYACEKGAKYGCVWDGTPPLTLATIGCR